MTAFVVSDTMGAMNVGISMTDVEISERVRTLREGIFKISKNANKRINKLQKELHDIRVNCPHNEVESRNMVSLCSCNETLYICKVCGKEWEGR